MILRVNSTVRILITVVVLLDGTGGFAAQTNESATSETRMGTSLDVINPTKAMHIVGNHLFVAAWGNGVQVLDISNPVQPKWVGGWNERHCPVGVWVTRN